MLFNSIEFLIFFPIVIAAYFALNHKYRWILLLAASYYFYMCWNYRYVVLILTTTVINYLAGMGIGHTTNKFKRKLYLIIGVGTSLGILFFFKYFNFFNESIAVIFNKFNIFYDVPVYHVLLPVGISFYTFQTLSYTLDVYFNREKVEYHFGIFALYVSFFPQLVAGPIERSTNLLPQFKKENSLSHENIKMGIYYILWGFFKKVVIADRLSEYVNIVYNSPHAYGGWHSIIATFFFSIQIYCDFSGYSDIAIGTARMMGFTLMTNFRRPYFALSIKEFWQRWHISLSTWFKDYFYIPMGGNRVSKARAIFNLFATFLVSGLWHGANWTFVVWGALHGFYSVVAVQTKNIRNKFNTKIGLTAHPGLDKAWQMFSTFVLVYFAWIFFRANNVNDAFTVIGSMFHFNSELPINLFRIPFDFQLAIIGIVLMLIVEIIMETPKYYEFYFGIPRFVKTILMALLLVTIFVFGVWEGVDFLYFQF